MWPVPTVCRCSSNLTTLETKHGNRNLPEQQHWVNGKIIITKYGMQACPNNNNQVTSTHSWHWPHRAVRYSFQTLCTLAITYYMLRLRLAHSEVLMGSSIINVLSSSCAAIFFLILQLLLITLQQEYYNGASYFLSFYQYTALFSFHVTLETTF